MEMGDEYDLWVQEIVHELEESGGESKKEHLSSKEVKEELIEVEMSKKESEGHRWEVV